MQKHIVPEGVEIDYCDAHGVWLDVGEMERLLARSAGSAARQSSAGKAVTQSFSGAIVRGAGFSVGHPLVSGIVNALFRRR